MIGVHVLCPSPDAAGWRACVIGVHVLCPALCRQGGRRITRQTLAAYDYQAFTGSATATKGGGSGGRGGAYHALAAYDHQAFTGSATATRGGGAYVCMLAPPFCLP